MATLQSRDLSFEFCFSGFEDGWVQYQFYFKWQGEPLVRDDLLKKWGEYWGSRPSGALLANEDAGDGFAPFLRKVLSQDKADYWEPTEPDIMVAIYPDDFFPFLPSHHKLIYESPELQAERKARAALKKEKGQLSDDRYTFMVFVDAYNLKRAGFYYGQGLTLQMVVNREELETFATCLEREYLEFKERFQVDRLNEEKDRMLEQLFTPINKKRSSRKSIGPNDSCAAKKSQAGSAGKDQKELAREEGHNGTTGKAKDSPELVQRKRDIIAEALEKAKQVPDKPKRRTKKKTV